MELIQAICYGLVQGLTEWLPISSTAHLRILPAVAGWPDPGAEFTAVIQLGTLLAVFIYFWKDLTKVFSGWIRGIRKKDQRQTSEYKMGTGMLIGSIPILVLGFIFKDQIENGLRSLYVIGTALIVMGIVLAIADRFGSQKRTDEDIQPKDGLWIGLWQAIALIPGASRSGSSISGALFLGLDRTTAARYSFLLSMPSILAAGVYSAYRHRAEFGGEMIQPILIANLVSFAVGLASIAFFMKVIKKFGASMFVVYRIILGVAILWAVQAGRLPAEASPMATAPVQVSR